MATAGQTWYEAHDATWQGLKREQYPYAFAENVIVRYVDILDPRDFESIVTYINTLPDINPKINNQAVGGAWTTLGAGYSPVYPEKVGGSIRIWHALVPAGTTTGSGFYITDNGCTFKVSLQFFWRLKTFPPTMPASTSGVSYSIASQNRDDKSGLWNCIMEKREQNTTTTGVIVVADDVFKTVSEQTFLGIRTGNLDENGAAVALWTVGNATPRTLVEDINVSKNENCTTNITQRKTVSKAVSSAKQSTEQTIFQKDASDTDSAQTTAVIAEVIVSAGVITGRSATENPDGTFDNVETKKTAIAVPSAILSTTQTIFGKEETNVDQNSTNSDAALVTVSGGKITEKTSDRNPDGTWKNSKVEKTAIARPNAVLSTTQTVFKKKEMDVDRNSSSAVSSLVSVSGGVVTERKAEENPDGTWNNTESKETAIPLSNAERTTEQTIFEKTASITDVNQSTAVIAEVVAANGVVTARSAKENPDGTFDNVETKKTAIAVPSAILSTTQTIFGKEETNVDQNSTNSDAALVTVSGGKITEKTSDRNPDGTWKNSKVEKTAIAVPNAALSTTQTVFKKKETDVDRNSSSAVSSLVSVSGGVVTERKAEENPDGTWDNTESKETAIPVSNAERTTEQTIFEKTASITDVNQSAAVIAEVVAANGVVTARSAKENPDGTFDNKQTLSTELQQLSAVEVLTADASGTVTDVQDMNVSTAGALPVTPTAGTLVEVVNKKTPGGWFVKTIKTIVATLWQSKLVKSTQDTFETVTETHDDAVANPLTAAPAQSAGAWYENISIKRKDRKYDTQQTLHQEKSVASAIVRTIKTLFTHVTETDSVDSAPLGVAPSAGAGIITENTDAKTKGGWYKRTAKVTTEQAVSSAVTTNTKTPFTTTAVTVNKAQSAAMATSADYGVTVQNDKTDGGLFDQTETVISMSGGGAGVEERSRTVWEYTRHVVTTWWRNLAVKKVEPTSDTQGQVIDIINTRNDLGGYDAQEEKDIAVAQNKSITIYDDDGEYVIFLRENNTEAELNSFIATLNSNRKISCSPSLSRYPGMINCTITSKDISGAQSLEYRLKYIASGEEKKVVFHHGDGKVIKEVYTITYNVKRDKGAKAARIYWDGVGAKYENWGSEFHDLGRDWYFWKIVTGVTLATTDVTTAYDAGTDIAL